MRKPQTGVAEHPASRDDLYMTTHRFFAGAAFVGVAIAAVGAVSLVPALAYRARAGEGFVVLVPSLLFIAGAVLAGAGWLAYLWSTSTHYRPPNAGRFIGHGRELP
jgi:hypothetical protein